MPGRICVEVDCGRPTSREPGMTSTKWCYWHRLTRMTIDAQDRARDRRIATDDDHDARLSPEPGPGEVACVDCSHVVPDFYRRGRRCVACARARDRATRDARLYGASPDTRERLGELQDGRCAICRHRQRDRAPAIDHDHKTSAVRGLLCHTCNHDLLGAAHDSPRILAAALLYLIVPPAAGRWVDPESDVWAVTYGMVVNLIEDRAKSWHDNR